MQYDDVTAKPIWRTAAILKIVFGYISTSDYPINAKFCRIKQNHMLTQDTWPKYQISKIQDGGRPPFWKSFYRYISAEHQPGIIRFQCNLVCSRKLRFQALSHEKCHNFANSTWRTAAIMKIIFRLYLDDLLSD